MSDFHSKDRELGIFDETNDAIIPYSVTPITALVSSKCFPASSRVVELFDLFKFSVDTLSC